MPVRLYVPNTASTPHFYCTRVLYWDMGLYVYLSFNLFELGRPYGMTFLRSVGTSPVSGQVGNLGLQPFVLKQGTSQQVVPALPVNLPVVAGLLRF